MTSVEEFNTPSPDLKALGVYDHDALREAATKAEEYLVEGLLFSRSINIGVGSSGLGKTPWAITLGVAVAAGLDLYGRKTKPGTVLYCDAESGQAAFERTLASVSAYQGLSAPPKNFLIWSPNWGAPAPNAGEHLLHRVRTLKPSLVIVDPLRVFWPLIERKSDEAANVIRIWREVSKQTGCSWFALHHRRKVQAMSMADLEADPVGWFDEAAGSHAIVNHSDTRIGLDKSNHPRADLAVAGFARSLGQLPLMQFAREFNDTGEPRGYRLLTGVDFLNHKDREAFGKLPDRFRFRDAHLAMGQTSDSTTSRFINQCINAQIVKKENRDYVKIGGAIGVATK